MKRSLQKYTAGDKIFYTIIFIILTLFFIAVLYPCVFVVSSSFSSAPAVLAGKVVLLPVGFSLEGYRTVMNTPTVWTGFRNSLFYTVSATILNIAMTLTTAYCLSRNDVPGKKFITGGI